MTREQAEKEIRDNFSEVWADGIIKALEQEPVIDKIKSIVAAWKTDTWRYGHSYECMIKIAEIIDKAENEG